MLYYLKTAYYKFLELLEPILDSFSSRVCFFCERNQGQLICSECLAENLSLKKKSIDYKILDKFFRQSEQVSHPQIFYLFNFFKETSYLIKKAKYSRPYFAKFFAELLAQEFIENINRILSEDLSDTFLQDLSLAEEKLNIYIVASPMFEAKKRDRSFNFAELLAFEFSESLSKLIVNKQTQVSFQSTQGLKLYSLGRVQYLKDFFLRLKNTKALFNLGLDSRLTEIKNAFAINQNLNISKDGLNILLIIDDICTTGSTLMELMKLVRNYTDFDDQLGFTLYGRNLT